ncbi:MAG: hypothetical protein EOO16_20670 [Chitinophagaceae bacterium]|nr:MAG: hypothetical protein EOO16_20670 [Chitinophagaceae bacterium]
MINLQNFLNEHEDPKAVEKLAAKLEGMLMRGEELIYLGVQRKPAVNIAPDGVALTTKRIIFCRPKNLGLSMDFQDCLLRDIKDTHFKEGMLGSEFMVMTTTGTTTTIDYLPKVQARKLHTLTQEQLEDQRQATAAQPAPEPLPVAAVAEVPPPPAPDPVPTPAPAPAAPQASNDDPMAVLQKLKQLYNAGLIDQMEYEKKKAEVLARM